MTVQDQHIDFKRKLNKIDSQNYRNFRPEEIDLYLNEGQEIFIKKRLGINNIYRTGFEATQKRIEDLRDIHIKWEEDASQVVGIAPTVVDTSTYSFDLTDLGVIDSYDYLYATRAQFTGSKTDCGTKVLDGIPAQADDLNNILKSEFYSPNFEWEEVPFNFTQDKIYVYTDSTFSIDTIQVDYIKRPAVIANPDAVFNSVGINIGYNHPDGTPAVQQDCELQSMYATTEIVDEAVRIAMIDLGDQRFQLADAKTKTNE